MTQEVRLWEILEGEALKEISQANLNYEDRIEEWLENDISIVSNDLLVIGRQVNTDFGGTIDLLCLDNQGDVVVVELKRDKTPREITAQVLDYASWVKDLSRERVTEIGDDYLGDMSNLEEAYRNKFGLDYPEIVNESHKMLVVASEIDASSERIIKYLSDSYGVGINAITFNYFKNDDGKEYLSRVFLIEPSDVEYKTRTKASPKRSKPLTFEEFQELADNNGVGEIYKRALEKLGPKFDRTTRHVTAVGFQGNIGDENSLSPIMVIYPYYSNYENGLYFYVYLDRLASYFKIDKETIDVGFPNFFKKEYKDWASSEIGNFYIKSEAELDGIISVLSKDV